MATRLEEKIMEILGSSVEKSVSLAFAIAPKEMKLRNAYSYNAVKKNAVDGLEIATVLTILA